jgi:hypothetical protein
VRGIGGVAESEERLRKVFGKFGKFVQASVRQRADAGGEPAVFILESVHID